MTKSFAIIAKCSLVAAAAGVIATATVALADPPVRGCWRNVECPDVWDPVICSDGQIYSNACYAWRACATGCVPFGGDPM